MPESLLNILKFCFLALLYLFFFRVIRAVWAEVTPQAAPVAAPARPVARERPRPAARGKAHLEIVEPAERRGKTFELGDEVTMGRGASCQIAVEDNFVSQLHARIYRKDGEIFVEDLGSTNGTYLNRKKLSGPVAIRRGDRIQVGKTVVELGP